MGIEETNKKKSLSAPAIYFKSWAFPWRRMKYYLIALLVAIAIICLFWYLGYLYAPAFLTWITVLGVLVAIFIFGKVATSKLKPLYVAHTAIMTEGLVNGVIPQPCIKEGFRLTGRVYTTSTFLKLFIQIFKAIKGKLSRKNKGENEGKTGSLWKEITSFILAQLAAMIPYLGACSSSWAMAHPDKDPAKTMGEGAQIFRDNFSKMLGIIAMNFIFVAAILAAGMIAVGNYLHDKVRLVAFIARMDELLGNKEAFLEWGHEPVTSIIVTAGIITVFYILFTFLRPASTIVVLQQFYNIAPPVGATENDPESKTDNTDNKQKQEEQPI